MQQAAVNTGDSPALEASERRLPWPRASGSERIVQAAVGLVLAAALAVGLALTPSPTGSGTHTLLGLPPCGMLVATGHPCPTCGVTTSFVLACHGRFADAVVNQPFGLVVFGIVVGGLLATTATLATRRSWTPLVSPGLVGLVAAVLGTLLVAAWAYKWATT